MQTPSNAPHLLGGLNAAATHRRTADQFYAPITPIVLALHRQACSLREIAAELAHRGIKPRRGKQWSAAQIKRILDRVRQPADTALQPIVATESAPPCSVLAHKHVAQPGTNPIKVSALVPKPEIPTPMPGVDLSGNKDVNLFIRERIVGPFTVATVAEMFKRKEIAPATPCRRTGKGLWISVAQLLNAANASDAVRTNKS